LAGVPGWQARVTTALWPGLRRLLVASLQVQARRLPELTEELDAELDWFGQHLAGRETLGSGGFGRDDITAASLLAPLTQPTVVPLYRGLRYPATVMKVLKHWNDRPALRWVAATYQRRR
jgi:glutathione S-transferase